ncbi:MAG TPA: hypothetical protein DDX86_01675, partial [Akkermansia sp.]|nr:hypothetical protein [Akkermansia sp.]
MPASWCWKAAPSTASPSSSPGRGRRDCERRGRNNGGCDSADGKGRQRARAPRRRGAEAGYFPLPYQGFAAGEGIY